VVALIAAPCFSMARSAKLTLRNIWIPIVSALLICSFGISPVVIILSAGIGGYIYGKMKK
jgi:chromate transporter